MLLEQTHHVSGGSDRVEAIAMAELESIHEELARRAGLLGGDWRRIVAEVQAERVPEADVLARHRQIFDGHRQLVIDRGLLTWPD